MPLHVGQVYGDDVRIGPPSVDVIRKAFKAPDVADSVGWLSQALERDDVYYFAIFWNEDLVGQILLHDMHTYSSAYWRQGGSRRNPVPNAGYPAPTSESLVAYHLFDTRDRGKGIGTKALTLLQRYTVDCTDLNKLVIITSRDNPASQRIAQKCGFRLITVGDAQEHPADLLEFVWDVPAHSEQWIS